MSRFWVSLFIMQMLVLVSITSCNKDPDQKQEKYQSAGDVSRFLKEQYFEVLDFPASIEDFEYTLLNGKKELFYSNRDKIILLNFWATWCYPCKKEMPDMQMLMNELEGEHFRLLAVNYGENPTKVKRFVEKFNYTFDVVTDTDRTLSTKLDIKGLPTTVLIDKKGRILGKLVGPANWSKKAFLEFFKTLSRKQP